MSNKELLPDTPLIRIGVEFKLPKVAILNSRQTKTPTATQPWIDATMKAIDQLKNTCILSSVEMNTYEFVLWYAGKKNLPQLIVCPLFKNQTAHTIAENIMSDFRLKRERVGFVFFTVEFHSRDHKNAWNTRDQLIIALADKVYPVSIRPKGNFERWLKALPSSKIDARFAVEYHPVEWRPAGIPTSEKINSDLSMLDLRYLIHWTHTVHSPFPGESKADYYESIVQSGANYSHSALFSLAHIIRTGTIHASGRGIKGNYPVVCLTELDPITSLSNIRWRSRMVRYTYEAYGLAIDKEYLKALGARPVIYGDHRYYRMLPPEDQPFFQFIGRNQRWTYEHEWRLTGDLDLGSIPTDKIKLLVRNRKDIDILMPWAKRYEILVICKE